VRGPLTNSACAEAPWGHRELRIAEGWEVGEEAVYDCCPS